MRILIYNIRFYILISIIIILSYIQLFLGYNLFNHYELDIHVMFDYLNRSNLSGWRLDKIIGSNMLIGDPSFNAWSFLSLLFNIPLQNKILLHNIIFILINFYAAFSLFYLLTFINPNLSKIIASILSSIVFISILRLEFNYVFSWALVFPTITLSILNLYNYFKTNKNKYIFYQFIIFFIGFNFGSIFPVQQSLFFSFLFFIFYSFFFKEKIFIKYIKIIFLSLFLLLITSSWIIFPYLYEVLFSNELFERTADYRKFDLVKFELTFFKLIYNTFLGSFINFGDINLPDRGVIPGFSWNNSLSIFFNLIFFFYLFVEKSKNFWVYLSKYILLFYIIHIFLSEISPIYYSFNLFILNTMSWSKVNIELYIFQLILLSFFINSDFDCSKNKLIRNYFFILFVYTTLLIFFAFDIIFDVNFSKNIAIYLLNLFAFTNFYNFIDSNSLNLFITDFYNRLGFLINYKFLLIHLSSLILLLFVFLWSSLKKNNISKFIFILIIFGNNYISASYFTPLDKDNINLWENALDQKVLKSSDRLISLTQNYMYNKETKKIDIKNLNEKNINDWIKSNPIKKKTKFYGNMSPPFLSFSSNASFVDKNLLNDNIEIFKLVPDKVKSNFTSENSFEILQEGIYDNNFINNLSVSHAYSFIKINEIDLKKSNLNLIWNDNNLFIYKVKDALPYFYIPKYFTKITRKFYQQKITKENSFFFDEDLAKVKNLNTGPAKYKAKIIDNSFFEIEYDSNYENILIISNNFSNRWKAKSEKDLNIVKANYYFTGIIMKPGNYKVEIYFDNSIYKYGIFISVLFIILIIFAYSKNYFNLRK